MSLVRGQIDDFVVASFPFTPRPATTRATRTTVSPVSYTSSAKTEHRVAVASPRVGLAVYDLEDQTPLSSVSVGPSFAPTTAPAARSAPLTPTESESTRVKSLRKTWIGVESAAAADDAAAAVAAEIWCFHEDENRDGSTPSADAAKAVWPISEPLAAIAAPRTLPNHIAFLSKNGNLALAPENDLTRLVSLAAPPLPANTSTLVSQTLRLVPLSATATATDYLPASLLAALPTATASVPHLAIIVRSYASNAPEAAAPSSLTGAGKKKHKKQCRPSAASVIEAAEAAAPSAAAPSSVPHMCEVELVLLDAAISIPDEFEPRQGMIRLGRVTVDGASRVVVSDEGFVTALDAVGTLSSYRLGFSSALAVDTYPTLFFPSTTSSPDDLSPLLDLSLSLVKSIALSKTTLIPSRTSLLALHSSFVALASPRPRPASSVVADSSAATGVSITYWDTRFGSVIAATELAVPSAVASNPDEVLVSLSKAGRRTAVVVLEPEIAKPSTESSSAVATSATSAARRTVLFGLPLNGLPSASVLAAVVGKQTLTARYIASTPVPSASSAASTPTSPAAVVLDRARRAEPLRSELARHGNEKKAALLEASRLAREEVLASLAAILEPLRNNLDGSAAAEEQDQAVHRAETTWERYIEAERDRLLEYNRNKVRLAMEKEKERRMAALGGGGNGAGDVVEASEAGEATGYKAAKRRIERALAAAGAPVRPTSAVGEGEKSWKEVTAARIKGVNDKYRYRYHLERNKKEAEMGKTVKEFDWEEAVNKVERYEPPLPSSFVTALLCLSVPVPLADPSASVEIAALPAPGAPKNKKHNAPAVWRHPTAIVGYLLGRELVGENQVEGGVTRFLARAGDWTNILVALRTISDIPESTLVSLLVAVVRDGARTTAGRTDGMDVDTPSSSKKTLPSPVPSLASFLAAFLQSPYTPAVLRQALQKQLSADEAVIVLEQCNAWLKRWLSEAEPVDASSSAAAAERKRKGKGSQAVAVDVFKVAVPAADVPSMDQIVPFVQAVLDAHFVNLLLQRQSHRLLRRLSQHVARHAELTSDLGTLLGALSIYSSKKKEEQRRSAAAVAAASAALEASAPTGKGPLASVKEFGATMEKRILAQEKHAEVGQYQVEEFFL